MKYQEHVFRPSRRVNDKMVKSRLYVGQYFFEGMVRPKRMALNTPDKTVAQERLRRIVVDEQKVAARLLAPKGQREAVAASIGQHVADYKRNLEAMGRAKVHVRGTIHRIEWLVRAGGWKSLADVTVESFGRAWETLKGSAKTKKEYQVSMRAFLNWLVERGRLEENSLQKLKLIDVRGHQVRPSRAFTAEEFRRLLGVAGRRAVVYQMLLYTGQRKEEVRGLRWCDLELEGSWPQVLIRIDNTKDKEKRAVPLHRRLATELRRIRPLNAKGMDFVFRGWFPMHETLQKDLARAEIPHKDALGRIACFHSFRKTWQTLGVRYGINQRSAQAILGHSDPSLTANVYTDVAALPLHEEIAKLPWIETEKSAHGDAHETVFSGPELSQQGTEAENPTPPKVTNFPLKSPAPSQTGTDGPVSNWWWRMDSNHRRSETV